MPDLRANSILAITLAELSFLFFKNRLCNCIVLSKRLRNTVSGSKNKIQRASNYCMSRPKSRQYVEALFFIHTPKDFKLASLTTAS